jgi:hypothetical protein
MRFENGIYHEPGIYFGMPEAEYHADWSIGSTDLMNLLISPLDYYWHSRANPHRRPDKETPAMQYGKAIHKRVLEGPEAFDKLYACKGPPPRPGALITSDDLKRHCEFLGLAKSGTKPQLIERIRQIDKDVLIHDEDVEAYKAQVEGKALLDEQDYAEIMLASQNIRANPHLRTAFEGGYPEVSVFWEVGGIPFRARFDYWKKKAIVDLKSTRNTMKMPWDQAVANFLARGKYYVQATHYMQGRQMTKKFLKAGKVFGEHDPQWVKQAVNEPDCAFIFVVYQAEGAPLVKPVLFDHEEPDYALGINDIATAVERYREGFEKFGQSAWVEDCKIERYTNLPWPMWRTGVI